MNDPVRHIVFDVGRVLLHWDPERAYLSILPDERERRWFLENVCTQAWNARQDRGRSWSDAEAELIARHPRHEENIRAYRANWHLMIPHAIDASVSLLEKLIERDHDVTLLTNFASDTFAEARSRFGFLDKPRGVTVSGHVGHLKPELAIYRMHAASFGLDPGAILFIDDSRENVEGAVAAGWQALLFTHPTRLQRDLKAHGLDV